MYHLCEVIWFVDSGEPYSQVRDYALLAAGASSLWTAHKHAKRARNSILGRTGHVGGQRSCRANLNAESSDERGTCRCNMDACSCTILDQHAVPFTTAPGFLGASSCGVWTVADVIRERAVLRDWYYMDILDAISSSQWLQMIACAEHIQLSVLILQWHLVRGAAIVADDRNCMATLFC